MQVSRYRETASRLDAASRPARHYEGSRPEAATLGSLDSIRVEGIRLSDDQLPDGISFDERPPSQLERF